MLIPQHLSPSRPRRKCNKENVKQHQEVQIQLGHNRIITHWWYLVQFSFLFVLAKEYFYYGFPHVIHQSHCFSLVSRNTKWGSGLRGTQHKIDIAHTRDRVSITSSLRNDCKHSVRGFFMASSITLPRHSPCDWKMSCLPGRHWMGFTQTHFNISGLILPCNQWLDIDCSKSDWGQLKQVLILTLASGTGWTPWDFNLHSRGTLHKVLQSGICPDTDLMKLPGVTQTQAWNRLVGKQK